MPIGSAATLNPSIPSSGSIPRKTFQFVDTGNAEVGFVALSQVVARPGGSRWIVPANLYREIRQDAVLLRTGTNNEAAHIGITGMLWRGRRITARTVGSSSLLA
jgi:hypothetical protein